MRAFSPPARSRSTMKSSKPRKFSSMSAGALLFPRCRESTMCRF
jgi:hypothetical protein